jgi:hypothetical protein
MTGELKDVLLGGMEAKRQVFASEDFAGAFGGGVVGRVKRRRAVSATAMGGGTLVAVGAIAVGAWQLPRAGVGVGGPVPSPSVVCTTTTPDAVAGSEPFANFAYAWVDEPGAPVWRFYTKDYTGTFGFAAWEGSTLVVTPAYGHVQRVDPDENGVYTFLLGGDITVTSDFADGPNSVISATIAVDSDLDVTASSVSVIAEDGTVLGRAVHMSDGTFALAVGNSIYPLIDPDGTTYTYIDDAGQRVKVTLVDTEPAAGTSQTAPSPSVTCVTASPEPSASASTSPRQSPTVSASESAVPNSPFQCGFEFSDDKHNDNGLFVGPIDWMTAAGAESKIREQYADPEAAPGSPTGADVPVATIDYNIFSNQFATNGMAVSGAPTDGGGYVLGYGFVIADGGNVVATFAPNSGASGIYFEFADGGTAHVYGLDVRPESFDACAGASATSIAQGQLYAVAGVNPNNGKGPYYAWIKVDR